MVNEITNQSGVYTLINLVNHKQYIGSAVKVKARIAQHFSDLKCKRHKNRILQNSYNKYGKAMFDCKVVEYCDKEMLICREQFWIDTLFFIDDGNIFNVNLVATSRLGISASEETKQKISNAKKGTVFHENARAALSLANKGNKYRVGKTLSNEHKAAIAKANSGCLERRMNKRKKNAKGYFFDKNTGKFRARVMSYGKFHELGSYEKESDAKAAFQNWLANN